MYYLLLIRNEQHFLVNEFPQIYVLLVLVISLSSFLSLSLFLKGPVSQCCPLTLDMPTLSTFNKLVTLLSHPQLFQVEEVGFISGRDQVLIIQPVCRAGSLKDAIYKVNRGSVMMWVWSEVMWVGSEVSGWDTGSHKLYHPAHL